MIGDTRNDLVVGNDKDMQINPELWKKRNEGGPMFKYVGDSSHNNNNFRKGHEHTFGKQDIFKNLAE